MHPQRTLGVWAKTHAPPSTVMLLYAQTTSNNGRKAETATRSTGSQPALMAVPPVPRATPTMLHSAFDDQLLDSIFNDDEINVKEVRWHALHGRFKSSCYHRPFHSSVY